MVEASNWLFECLDPAAATPLAWLCERYAFIAQALRERKFSRDAAIVPQSGAKSRLATVEIDGGRDAKFVVVYVRDVPADWRPGVQETLTYGRHVAGTDLIYDLTGEFLQGKARPFVADLRELPLRVYAVLPFQIERIDLAAQQRVEIPAESKSGGALIPVRLRFLDGRGEPISARLPYCAAFRDPGGDLASEWCSFTQPEQELPKHICLPIPRPDGRWTLTLRSLLTGDEAALPFEVAHVSGFPKFREASLTSTGLKAARDPRPVRPNR